MAPGLQDIIDAQRGIQRGAVPSIFPSSTPGRGPLGGFGATQTQTTTTTPPPTGGLGTGERIPFKFFEGFYPFGFSPLSPSAAQGITDADVRESEVQLITAMNLARASGTSVDEAIALLQFPKDLRDSILGVGGTSGGSSVPLWRPGELELMLNRFGLEKDAFEEARNEFRQEFGLREDQFGLSERTLAEQVRANRAAEADRARGRGLQAAGDALSAYMRASESRDARQIGVLSSLPGLLPSLVSPDQDFFTGLEPGGLLARAAARFGLGDIGAAPVVPVDLNIGDFIKGDPETANIREELINAILGLGGVAGSAAATEGTALQGDATAAQGARAVPGGTVFAGGSPAQKIFNEGLA